MQSTVFYEVDELTGEEQQVVFVDQHGVEIQYPEGEDFIEDGQYQVVEYVQEAPPQWKPRLPPKDNKLKPPPNEYMLFNAKNQELIVDQNPNLTNNGIQKKLGICRKNLSSEEKEPYLEEAQKIKDEFELNHPKSKKTSRSLKRVRQQNQMGKAPSQLTEECIKRPPNSFVVFMSQKRVELAGEMKGMKSGQKTVYMGNLWKSLTKKEKLPYEEIAAKARKDHKLNYPEYKYSSIKKPSRNPHLSLQSSSTYPLSLFLTNSDTLDQAPDYDDLNHITPTVRVAFDFPWKQAFQSIGINSIPSNY
uniref:Sex-determining region Y protein n=1 Tax=Caenorhabditis tropicalis TaxID=1561998 RepID=A0A1I7TXA8_9PELO